MSIPSRSPGVPAWFIALALAPALTLMLAVAGCSDAPETAPSAESETVTLRLAVSDALPMLDPFLQNTAASNWMLYGNVFEGLVRFEDGEPLAALATSWTQEDDSTWVFTLRPGVSFHDGSPMTAADVVASFERALRHPQSAISARVAQVDSVEARDDETVAIRLAAPSQGVLRGFAMVPIVAHASSPGALESLIATGPYRIVGYETEEHLLVGRYPGYWGQKPQIGRAEFLFEADEARRAQMLIDGDVDLANQLEPGEIERIESRPELWVESSLGTNIRMLVLNTSVAPYSDPRVREAIDLAIDREALVAERYDGYARPAFQLAGPDSPGHLPELAESGGRDLDRARRLVAEASIDGAPKLRMHCGGPAPTEALSMEAQLEEAGFDVEIVAIEWATLYPRIQAGEIPFVYQGWSNYSGHVASTFEEVIHSFSPDGQLGKANHGRYSNPEADHLIEKAMVTRDPELRREMYEKISRIVAEDRPIIPLVRPLGVFGLRRDLRWAAPSTGALTLSDMRLVDGNNEDPR